MENMMVELFHWSLNEIDGTPMERLLPFVFSYGQQKRNPNQTQARRSYADQVNL